MTYPWVHAFHDLGVARGPRLGFTIHMAEGGGTVGFLSRANRDGVSVHYVIEQTGRIVQMLDETHMHSSIRIGEGGSALRRDIGSDGFGFQNTHPVLGDWALTEKTLGPNQATLAVEIEGFALAGPNAMQHASLRVLVRDIRTRYPYIGLLGHRDHNVKACPGRFIHWDDLGGHGGTMGLHLTLPPAPLVGSLAIPAGTDSIRAADGVHYTVPTAVKRPAYTANLTGPNSGAGYLVDLNGDELHFIRSGAGDFTAPPPVVDCDDAVQAELERASVRASAAVLARS